ncbi:type III pantothenate kinase [Candidatus Sumerlaeota bacterium]|nr:type III pantothenate kinase [Candidatus Sumerlaeota bacterium]
MVEQVTICIDAGNSRMKVGFFRGDQLVEMESVWYARPSTWDTAAQLVQKASRDVEGIRCAVACGRSPKLRKAAEDVVSQINTATSPVWLDSESRIPFRMNYTGGRPGADRIANVFALRRLAPNTPAVVVDFGTSTHIESTDAEGHFAGGLIMMGLGESRRALAEATAGTLALDERSGQASVETIRDVFAFSTMNALNNGLLLQQTAAVEHFLGKARERWPSTRFFATGGHAKEVGQLLRTNAQCIEELTLVGLLEFANHHFQA